MFDFEKLLAEHRKDRRVIKTNKISFLGVDASDVYNISHAFRWKDRTYIAGRVESRQSEVSEVRIFEQLGPYEYVATRYRLPMLQDPCVEFINDTVVIGGTEIYPDETGKITSWRTVFYQGKDFDKLHKVLEAPLKMKDVRLHQGKRLYVMSRPQGGFAKWGKIGFTEAGSIGEVTSEMIAKAPVFNDIFDDVSWGGANQIIPLKNGYLGILGHVARMSEGDVRHYYGMVFAFNPENGKHTDLKIICERSDFAKGAAKRPDLTDVVFVGGIVRNLKQKTASLYTGLSDAEAHVALIRDPFAEYEENDFIL